MDRKHVLVLTFPAFGHAIPLLELARKIGRHHDVTFAVSQSKAEKLIERELYVKHADEKVTLLGIDDEALQDFDDPDDPEAFAAVFRIVLPAIQKLLEEMPIRGENGQPGSAIKQPVDVIISDAFLGAPLTAVCPKRGIPYYLFNTAQVALAKYYVNVDENMPLMPQENIDPFMDLAPKPGDPIPMSQYLLDFFLPVRKAFPHALGMIHNSFEAIDKDDLGDFKTHPETFHMANYCVGPLLPGSSKISDKQLIVQDKVKTWLNDKPKQSVIYVSFGSMTCPAPEQITIVGKALLKLGKKFIFSLRENKQEFLPEEIKEKINNQFENPDSQFLILNWAPQKMVLEHPAIAVFLSHGGWNSILESLSCGVPFVIWPLFADQLHNGKWLSKLGVAVLIEGTGIKPKRVVPEEEIVEAVRKVGGFDSDGDSSYRDAAELWKREIMETLSDEGNSTQDILLLCKFNVKK